MSLNEPRDRISLPLPDRLSLVDRRVLVTGAARGIGQATALALADLGATLVLADILPLTDTASKLDEKGAAYECMPGDLCDDTFIDALLAKGPFFSFANCAGIFRQPAEASPIDGFDHVMHINVRAPFRLAQGCIDQMAKRGEGYIVLVGSAAGHNGGIQTNTSDRWYAEYAASKGALHTVVKWLARRAVKVNVRVNSIAPGIVLTPGNADIKFDPNIVFLPLGRAGRADELGWSIALMCTPAASFMAGVILDVNGGSYVS